MKLSTRQKAEIATSRFDARAIEKGFIPCVPVVDSRFDRIVVDTTGKPLKVQVKYTSSTSSNSQGSFQVNLRVRYNKKNHSDGYSRDEVDAVVVFIADKEKLCWLPPDVFEGYPVLTMRTMPTKNGQSKGVLWYMDYVW